MSDKIAEIRERWAEFESLNHQSQVWDAHLYMRRAHNDRATLLAEVDRQRAGVERLRAEIDTATRERDDARSEIKRLRAENAELQRSFDDGYSMLEATQQANDKLRADNELLREEIKRLRAGNEKLREALSWYADQRNHFPVERRSPGDPDPAVVFVEEPPIMIDNGRRARAALEGKP